MLVAAVLFSASGCGHKPAAAHTAHSLAATNAVVVALERLAYSGDREAGAVFLISNTTTKTCWCASQDGQPAWNLEWWQHGRWQPLTRRECADFLSYAPIAPHQSVAFRGAFLRTNIPQRVVVQVSSSSNAGYGPIYSENVIVPE
jgi:hypothetical protein